MIVLISQISKNVEWLCSRFLIRWDHVDSWSLLFLSHFFRNSRFTNEFLWLLYDSVFDWLPRFFVTMSIFVSLTDNPMSSDRLFFGVEFVTIFSRTVETILDSEKIKCWMEKFYVWCIFSCCFMLLFVEAVWSQIEHLKSFFPSCLDFLWRLRFDVYSELDHDSRVWLPKWMLYHILPNRIGKVFFQYALIYVWSTNPTGWMLFCRERICYEK